MATVWLDIHYKGVGFDFAVYDVDLMQVFDLIADLGPAAMKQNVLIPDTYDMYYLSREGNKVYIRGDRDLVGMFENLQGDETINIWLEEIGKKCPAALEYLNNVTQQWSIHTFDPNVACHHNTSNFVESFNALINKMRELPVMNLMEEIRKYYMGKFAERMELAESMGSFDPTPYAKDILSSNCSDSTHCSVIKAGGGEYDVQDGNKAFPVNIVEGTCLCGAWQSHGIPCKHACRAIYHNNEEPIHYIHGFYHGQCYKLTYGTRMHPIPDKDQWPSFDFPEVKPPVQERGSGRPIRQRKRAVDDPKKRKGKRSSTVTCSICKTLGHNARGCQGGPTAKQKRVDAAATAAASQGRSSAAASPDAAASQGSRVRSSNVGASQGRSSNVGAAAHQRKRDDEGASTDDPTQKRAKN